MGCIKHPSNKTVSSLFGGLCDKCAKEVEAEHAKIGSDILPKECFVTFKGKTEGWQRIKGTGCAHWVAHERNIKHGFAGSKCAEGFTIRVPDVISGARKINRDTEEVKVDDIWANPKRDHCGLVVKVEETKVITKEGDKEVEKTKQKITIRHCSSSAFGSGGRGIVTDDFEKHFKGLGDFFRL